MVAPSASTSTAPTCAPAWLARGEDRQPRNEPGYPRRPSAPLPHWVLLPGRRARPPPNPPIRRAAMSARQAVPAPRPASSSRWRARRFDRLHRQRRTGEILSTQRATAASAFGTRGTTSLIRPQSSAPAASMRWPEQHAHRRPERESAAAAAPCRRRAAAARTSVRYPGRPRLALAFAGDDDVAAQHHLKAAAQRDAAFDAGDDRQRRASRAAAMPPKPPGRARGPILEPRSRRRNSS